MNYRTSAVTAGMILVLFVILTLQAAAQISRDVINYQGKLTDSTGHMDGPVTMDFAIHDTETPGSDTPLWLEGGVVVEVENGVFSVSLGAQTAFPADLFDTNDDLYLSITVEGEKMTPLQHLTATPYAMKAGTADHAHTATAADSVLTGTITGNLLVDGSVGIGTGIPESLMHLTSMSGIDLIIEADTNNIGEDQNARVILRQDGGEVTGRMGYRDGENDLELMQEFNDDLILGTSALDRVTINRDGEVTIHGYTSDGPLLRLKNFYEPGTFLTPRTFGRIDFVDYDDKHWGSLYQHSATYLEPTPPSGFHLDSDNAFYFSIREYPRMSILSGGNIGIGTESPEAKLHIVMPGVARTPSTTPGLVIRDTEYNTGNRFEIQNDYGNAKFVVTPNGWVGIGTDTPDASLEVDGNGEDPLAGFLILKNDRNDAGIRLYNGNDFEDVKHHIFNDTLFFNSLRIVPDGTFADGGITITQGGYVGIGTGITPPNSRLMVNGRTVTSELEITGGSDLSEGFNIIGMEEDLLPAPGMVVSIDPQSQGSLMIASTAYDRKVAGIISGAGGINPGMVMGQEDSRANGSDPVALTGRVYCWADGSGQAIVPGDLLTTSNTPGHAMKVMDYQKAQGAILGKAMTGLADKKGLVLVLVSLQ